MVRNVDDKFGNLLKICNGVPGTGIVYVRERKRCEEISSFLRQNGITADFYHAGLSKELREAKQDAWKNDSTRVIVATNAFGMGIDKPDVRLVVHIDLPSSIEAYFQEAGRAGRDGKDAYAVTLFSRADRQIVARRLSDNYPSQDFIREIYDEICYYYSMALGDGLNCTYEFSLGDFCKDYHRPTLQTDSALRILTRMGYLEYVEEMEYSSRVRFIVGKDALYRFRGLPADYELLVNALLRNYSGLFSDYVFIDERYLSRITKLSRHRMYEIFVSMSNRGLVSYAPSKKCPIITFTRHRVLGSELRFAREVYDERKAIFGERLKSMLNYATSDDKCRSRLLLEYFGEKGSEECRRCDVCVSKRAAVENAPAASSVDAIMQLLSDCKLHPLDELSALGLTEAETKRLLRQLCDEEQIKIVNGKIMK